MRTRLWTAAAAAVLALGGVAEPLGAPVEAASPVSVTITGRGFGHGIGMSQYGALQRAQDGQGYRQIVKHYYPGTTWGTATGRISVLITGNTTNRVVVEARPKLAVRSLGAKLTWTLPAQRDGATVKRWRITPAPDQRSAVSYRAGGTWYPWRTVLGDAQFEAGGAPITLVLPAGTVQYRGVLRSASANASATSRDTVNVLTLESYLRGVVPQEMPALWPAAAVRSQAVAARTYAAYERDHPMSADYDICDTAHCQVYGGYSAEYSTADDAVVATAGQVLDYDGGPAFTQFTASNGGYSVAGSFPYLPAAPDPYDEQAYPEWTVTIPGDQIDSHWPAIGNLESVTVDQRDGNGDWGGRVQTLTLTGDRGSTQVSGATFASYLGLRSTLFEDPQTTQT